jgi:L-lactate dehydrogenase
VIELGRIAIIGAGHVGATTAYALMLRALVREIVLIDDNEALAEAEARDLMDANALARPARIWAGDYEDASTAAIAIITAGAATHGSESRLAVTLQSADIVGECADQLAASGFKGIVVVASNPVDVMAMTAFERMGLPAAQVIGTGTLLDSSRFRQALASRLKLAPQAIEAMVIGEHGDSEVASFSTVRAGGTDLDQLGPAMNAAEREAIAKEVASAAYRIIGGKGYTSFGIATATVRICEAIARDEHAVMPVSTLATGQLGIEGVYLSLPCVLGRNGVEAILTPALSEAEQAQLLVSAELLRSSF